MKRVVFMGTPEFAAAVLSRIYEVCEVVGVFTQPDRPAGRGGKIAPTPVKQTAINLGVATEMIFQPSSLKNSVELLKGLKPDFIIVAAYAMLLPKAVLDIAPCINLHASILPAYRGASPIQMAVLNGDEMGGVTAMMMSEGLDEGDMLAFSVCDIKGANAGELFDRFSNMAGELAAKVLMEFERISPLAQTHALASKCGKIQKSDGLISFKTHTARQIALMSRAFWPWPGVFLDSGVKIIEASECSGNADGGQILNIVDDGFVVAAKSGAVLIKTIQEPGKKAISAKDYLNGKRLKIGDYI